MQHLVNQKSQDMRFVTKLLCGLTLEYTQLSKAPLVILSSCIPVCSRAVTNSWGPGASQATMRMFPGYFHMKQNK